MKYFCSSIILFTFFYLPINAQQIKELKRFHLKEVKQGVAVDKNFFYVINNTSITKHLKTNGKEVASWKDTTKQIIHLNSGVVIEDKLYCAHSNYPQSPMASSIEIFDTKTLRHIGNHSFGIFKGSATWVDWYNNAWWVMFAHYTGKGSSEGKDTRWTSLVKFDKNGHETASWIFPQEIIETFAPKSNSGGMWGTNGKLYCTGHDKEELYVLQLPEAGFQLQLLQTIRTISSGQAFSFDRSIKNKTVIYGIGRNGNEVIIQEIEE